MFTYLLFAMVPILLIARPPHAEGEYRDLVWNQRIESEITPTKYGIKTKNSVLNFLILSPLFSHENLVNQPYNV